MASLISCATGNFTSSGTWAVVDSTSYLDFETANNTTTTYLYSSTFTPGAITVDGIAIKVLVVTTNSGTVSVELFNNTDTVSVTSVTVNVADVQVGWNFFKFGSSQTLTAGKAYKVGIKTSTNLALQCGRDATTSNWARALRTTTTQAPAASDQLIITGELTGAGTGNNIAVTMNNTATTTFGTTTYLQSVHISNRGTLTWGTSASTNYYLKVKGIIDVMAGGTWTMGTSGTRIPTSSTAVLEFDSTANVDSGIRFQAGSTYSIYGAAKTRWTYLTADKAAAATVIALTDTTGWAASDTLAFASTSRTVAQYETKSITSVDSSTQVTLSAGLTNAHTGTSPYIGEVGNLTSNLKIRGISTSLQGYMLIATTSSGTIDNAEFYNMGSATAGKRGIDVQTTTGSCTINACAIHDFVVASSIGINISGSTANNITISSNVIYAAASNCLAIAATSGTACVIDGNFALAPVSSHAFSISDVGGTITNNVAACSTQAGYMVNEINVTNVFSGNVAHTCTGGGFNFANMCKGTIASIKSYLNPAGGVNCESIRGQLTFTNIYSHSNLLSGFSNQSNISGNGTPGELVLIGGNLDSSVSFGSQSGVNFTGGSGSIILEGVAIGATVAHGIASVQVISANNYSRVVLRNCTFTESTFITGQSNLDADSYILSQRHNGTAGSHRGYYRYGSTTTDTTIFNTASPSLRMTPTDAANKEQSSPVGKGYRAAVASGGTVTASVYVRKSVVGDGTAYTGNQPRLVVRKNVAAGITSDTVLATASGVSGSWEQLSGTTASVTDDAVLEFFVDCDGTAGWVNVDDFATTVAVDSKGLKFWADGLPVVQGDNTAGGTTVGYFSY